MKENWHKHFGIYGIVRDFEKILLIKKNKGPYKGKYDLPGGSINQPESLLDNLKREFIEETGYTIEILNFNGICDILINEEYKNSKFIHHIALFYNVKLIKKISRVKNIIDVYGLKEKNDSDGLVWEKTINLNEDNSSPLVLEVVKGKNELPEMKKYLF